MIEAINAKPALIRLIEVYEQLRAQATTLAKLENARDLRAAIRDHPAGVFHGGYRYSYSRSDADVVRIKWSFHRQPPHVNHSKPPMHGRPSPGVVGARTSPRGPRIWDDD